MDPLNLLGMFRGVNNGGWDPNENNFQLYTIVIGSQTLHATGYAMGIAKDGADAAVIAYFGDGASSQGDVAEAFTFARGLQRAGGLLLPEQPVGHLRAHREAVPGADLPARGRLRLPRRPGGRQRRARGARGHPGGPGARPRPGSGPMLVEAFTYRMGAHTTSDDPTRYRLRRGAGGVGGQGPDRPLKAYLTKARAGRRGVLRRGATQESDALAKRVRDGVRIMPDPDPMAIFENVYADGHALVDEERAQFAAYTASFEDAQRRGDRGR